MQVSDRQIGKKDYHNSEECIVKEECPECGKLNAKNVKFCHECGHNFYHKTKTKKK